MILSAITLIVILSVVFVLLRQKNKTTYLDEVKTTVTQSESTEVDSIENDILNTNLENIDSELDDIEEDLNSSN